MQLKCSEFGQDETIPRRFTADGDDVSPPLAWSDVPDGTTAFALIVEDPDAPRGTWQHWLLYDLPGDTRELPAAIPPEAHVLGSAKHGKNDFGDFGYGGPAPPPPAAHRYVFQLLALDQPTGLDAGASRRDITEATRGHVLAKAQLIGRYNR